MYLWVMSVGRQGRLACAIALITITSAGIAEAEVQRAGPYRYVQENVDIPDSNQAEHRVYCPGKTQVYGGGLQVSDVSVNAEMAGSAPFDGPDNDRIPDDGWVGRANPGPLPGGNFTTFAVCASHRKMSYGKAKIVAPSGARTSAYGTCSTEGPVVMGGGVLMRGSSTDVTIAESYPAGNRDAKSAWEVAVNNTSGAEAKGKIWVSCRKGSKQGLNLIGLPGNVGTGRVYADQACQADRFIVGGGAQIAGGLGTELASSYPIDTGDDDTVPDDGWANLYNNETGSPQFQTTWNVCTP